MASSILINQLVVVGIRKNYTVNFNAGVNIIYGDVATGKSSILDLIDYLLGARKFQLYPEISSAGRYAILDVTLNDDRYTIRRNIFDSSKPIEVFPCGVADIEKYAVRKYLPTFKPNAKYAGLEFFSDFILSALNLTNLKIKNAPTKDDSKLSRLSFRDIVKYCYVDQDDLGSKKFMKSDNYALRVKNSEVFKYIFNALDTQTYEIEQDISDKSQKKILLEKKFTFVSDFLRESEFGSMLSLDDDITKTDDDIFEIQGQIEALNGKLTADNEVYRAIKTSLNEIQLERNVLEKNMLDGERKIERFTRLRNDYLTDIAKFNSSLTTREVIGEISAEVALCPVCDGDLHLELVKEKYSIVSANKIKDELGFLKRRVRDTEQLINEVKKHWELDSSKIVNIEDDEERARSMLDENTQGLVSPYLAERDMYVKQLGELKQMRKDFVSRLKIRNQHGLLTNQIQALEKSIGELKIKLDQLSSDAPSMSNVLTNLADNLQRYLSFVSIKDPTGVSYDSKYFAPLLRNIEYENHRSGGIKTIVGIGYLCSLIEEALKTEMNYPSFIMIDTVGKYLGKTTHQYENNNESSIEEDLKEGVSDPQKYQNIFEHILNLSEMYEKKNRICQFILVDNDVPDHIMERLSGFIVAHFSSERVGGLPVGFIDDATS